MGTAWNQIVEMAKSWNADMVVIGTHGRTGLKHALLGSTAERVVRHAACPVLVVHSPTK
jgi:universal stress protein A